MSGPNTRPETRQVRVGGHDCRVWEQGTGEVLGVLGGIHGLTEWTPFLDALAARRRVVAPSLPGWPGADGHRDLDTLVDWIAVTLDLLEAAGLAGADLVGHGPSAALAAEVAALSRASVGRLVMMAPMGLFDEAAPAADIWARRRSEIPALFSTRPDDFARTLACPEGEDETEWQVLMTRAAEAGARLLWPTGDTGLAKRLHRITAPTLLLWGAEDRVVPPAYARRFADAIAGPTEIKTIAGAGHRLDFDAPEAAAEAIVAFLDS